MLEPGIGGNLGLPALIAGASGIEVHLAAEDDRDALEVSGKIAGFEFDAQAQLQALDTLDRELRQRFQGGLFQGKQFGQQASDERAQHEHHAKYCDQRAARE